MTRRGSIVFDGLRGVPATSARTRAARLGRCEAEPCEEQLPLGPRPSLDLLGGQRLASGLSFGDYLDLEPGFGGGGRRRDVRSAFRGAGQAGDPRARLALFG